MLLTRARLLLDCCECHSDDYELCLPCYKRGKRCKCCAPWGLHCLQLAFNSNADCEESQLAVKARLQRPGRLTCDICARHIKQGRYYGERVQLYYFRGLIIHYDSSCAVQLSRLQDAKFKLTHTAGCFQCVPGNSFDICLHCYKTGSSCNSKSHLLSHSCRQTTLQLTHNTRIPMENHAVTDARSPVIKGRSIVRIAQEFSRLIVCTEDSNRLWDVQTGRQFVRKL